MKNMKSSEQRNNEAVKQEEMMLGISTFWVCDTDGGKETAIGAAAHDLSGIFSSTASSQQYVMRDETESFVVL